MAFNGSGLFSRVFSWTNDAANSINIRADRMDAEMDGFAAGLSNCITRDGQGKPSAAMDWNGQNLANVNTLGANALTIATTPAQLDASTKGANTAFVQRALGNYAGAVLVSGAKTLTAADYGVLQIVNGIGTQTLPPAVTPGTTISILSAIGIGSAATIVPAAADTINTGSSLKTSITLQAGDSVTLTCAAVGAWVVTGSGVLGSSGLFAASFSDGGYQKLPSGLILQWGVFFQNDVANTATPFSITYPTAFPTATLQAFLTPGSYAYVGTVGSTESFAAGSLGGYTSSPTTVGRLWRYFAIGC